MTSLTDIQSELQSNIKFQATPILMTNDDYISFTLQGIKRLYVDEGIENDFLTDYDKTNYSLVRNLTLTEQEYAYTAAEIAFRNQIIDDCNSIIGYTTDAIAITGANAPFKNQQGTIKSLEDRLSQLAFTFTHKQVT